MKIKILSTKQFSKLKLKNLQNSFFAKNVLFLSFGNGFAQIISFLFIPLLTRIYNPEIFGILGVFSSFISIVTPLISLSYPIAISFSESDLEARAISRLSIYLGICLSITISTFFVLCNSKIITLLKIDLLPNYYYLIPFTLVLGTLNQVHQQWYLRKKVFIGASRISIIQSLFSNSLKLAFGYISPSSLSIILATVSSSLINSLISINILARLNIKVLCKSCLDYKAQFSELKTVALKYSDFALFRSPQIFINTISINFPILILSGYFGATQAGLYSIASIFINIPSITLGKGFGDVFYSRVVEAKLNSENIGVLLFRATFVMALVGIIPFVVVLFFGEQIFSIILGQQWSLAGKYASYLSMMVFFGFINKPVVTAIPILKLQKWLLKYEIISSITKIFFILVGVVLLNDHLIAVLLYSISGAVTYAYLIFRVIFLANKSFYNEFKAS
jgi:O-antigen/teichoic acid export membrane protein